MLRRLSAWVVALLATFAATPEGVDALAVAEAEERRNPQPLHSDAHRDQRDQRHDAHAGVVQLLSSLQHDVGRIRIIGGDMQADLAAALRACRDRGDLKVQLLLGSDATLEPIEEVAVRCGLHFSRQRRFAGEQVAEYYVDLYAVPKWADGAP